MDDQRLVTVLLVCVWELATLILCLYFILHRRGSWSHLALHACLVKLFNYTSIKLYILMHLSVQSYLHLYLTYSSTIDQVVLWFSRFVRNSRNGVLKKKKLQLWSVRLFLCVLTPCGIVLEDYSWSGEEQLLLSYGPRENSLWIWLPPGVVCSLDVRLFCFQINESVHCASKPVVDEG